MASIPNFKQQIMYILEVVPKMLQIQDSKNHTQETQIFGPENSENWILNLIGILAENTQLIEENNDGTTKAIYISNIKVMPNELENMFTPSQNHCFDLKNLTEDDRIKLYSSYGKLSCLISNLSPDS